MGLVYLAGPIGGLSYKEAKHGWRQVAHGKLHFGYGHTSLSPMRDKSYLADYTSLPCSGIDGVPQYSNKALVTRDRNDVRRCDAVLMCLVGAKTVSRGTMVELGWADAFGKPVVVVMEDGNVHDHGFVRELAGWVVPTVEEAVMIIGGILGHGI